METRDISWWGGLHRRKVGVPIPTPTGSGRVGAETSGQKENDQIFVLLIKPSGATQNQEKKWTFPKGWIDQGEKPEQAAVREVKEEAGVEAKIIEKLGSVKYTFKWEGENIFKIVTYYLMEYVSGDPKDHDFEVATAEWFELTEAENMLSYKTDKEIFEKARKILTKPPQIKSGVDFTK